MSSAADRVQQLVTRTHTAVYRASKGKVGGKMGRVNICLLTTTGRKSGAARTTPLNYVADGERILLVASNGGSDRHPAWFLNIEANPAVTIQRQDATSSMTARVATADEKTALWPKVVAAYAGYAKYQQKTHRDIPLVIVG
jgi:deazaflavin-dependent oxidoreductase (nitroreductase family)